jgi:hypothetical protein
VRSALVGHTGFVGSNLLRQARFDDCFNSRTITQIRGRSYDLLVCAGLPAAKWIANREPEADRANMLALSAHLSEVEAREVVLVSTVDVYAVPFGVDERTRTELAAHPYGAHRLEFERLVRSQFARVTVVRLPALFGPGLRKNVLYDLLHGNQLEAVDPASEFQWYDVGCLWADVEVARSAGLDLVNLAVEPVATGEILTRCFPGLRVGGLGLHTRYDMRTRHAAAFGCRGPYLRGRHEVLDGIAAFVEEAACAA